MRIKRLSKFIISIIIFIAMTIIFSNFLPSFAATNEEVRKAWNEWGYDTKIGGNYKDYYFMQYYDAQTDKVKTALTNKVKEFADAKSSLTFRYDALWYQNEVLCGNLGRDIEDGEYTYKLKDIIKIDGKVASANSKNTTNNQNLRLAYLLYNGKANNNPMLPVRQYNKGSTWFSGRDWQTVDDTYLLSYYTQDTVSTVQKLMWRNLYNWYKSNGGNGISLFSGGGLKSDSIGGTSWGRTAKDEEGNEKTIPGSNYNYETIETNANKYVTEYNQTINLAFDSSITNISLVTINGTKYYRLRFKLTYGDTKPTITFYDQNGTQISSSLIKYSTASDSINGNIASGANSYAFISQSDAMNSSITSIKMRASKTVKKYSATLHFYESTSTGSFQTIFYYKPSVSDQTVTKEITVSLIGGLKIVKQDNDNTATKLPNVQFKIKTSSGKYIVQSGSTIKYNGTSSTATVFTTNSSGEISISNLLIDTYTAEEVVNPNYGYTALPTGSVTLGFGSTTSLTIKNTKNTGNLLITKTDKDETDVKLANVEFVLQCTSGTNSGKYVQIYDESNQLVTSTSAVVVSNMKFTTDKSQATIFKTDASGEIIIINILTGQYKLIETKNPNYGYDVTSSDTLDITVNRQTSVQTAASNGTIADSNKKTMTNKRAYISIDGFVWKDLKDGKSNVRDDLYLEQTDVRATTGEVKVYLKDKDGNIIQSTDLNENGEYKFEKVNIDDMKSKEYYIEFEYDGQTYQSVIPHIDLDNGSKANENETVRNDFVESFREITNIDGNNQENKGYGRNENGDVKANLTYKKVTDGNGVRKSEYVYGNDLISSTTNEAGFYLKDQTINSDNPNITGVNFGIYARDYADMAVIDDIKNVKLTINGYENTYNYNARTTGVDDTTASGLTDDQINDAGNGFNLGVKFAAGEDSYGNMTYTTPIYKADAVTAAGTDENKLKVYITYVTTIRNQSPNLNANLTEIVNYIDDRCAIVESFVGDKSGNKTKDIVWSEQSKYNNDTYHSNDYKGYYTTTLDGTLIAKGQKMYIYTTLQLSDDAVYALVNDDRTTLENVIEINSYEMYDTQGNAYGAIDVDSAPGNAIPGDKTTYEDDTDSAPSLLLDATKTREFVGNVFEDDPLNIDKDEINSGEERLGNGIYEAGTENLVSGVKVDLCRIDNAGNTTVVDSKTTGADGTYLLGSNLSVTPGKYMIKYTYTDGTTKIYDVSGNELRDVTTENFKSTIQNSSLNYSSDTWYKDGDITAKRYSDAKDDTKYVDDQSTSRTASTTVMNVGIEIYTSGGNYQDGTYVNYEDLNKLINQIQNIDFGIIERAKQQATLTTEVDNITITMANGTPLVNYDPSSGETVSYVKVGPSEYEGIDEYTREKYTALGNIFIEIDDELLHGSHLEVTYKITAKNIGEADYNNDNYYYYGTDKSNPVTTIIEKIVDYLDEEFTFEPDIQDSTSHWTVATAADLDGEVHDKVKQALASYDNTVITSTDLATPLKPGETSSTTLRVQKTLSTTADDLSFDDITEIVDITNTSLKEQEVTTPGNYNPTPGAAEDPSIPIQTPETLEPTNIQKLEVDTGPAPVITITPPTGENRDYVIYTIIGVTALVILGVGVYFINKKVLK